MVKPLLEQIVVGIEKIYENICEFYVRKRHVMWGVFIFIEMYRDHLTSIYVSSFRYYNMKAQSKTSCVTSSHKCFR